MTVRAPACPRCGAGMASPSYCDVCGFESMGYDECELDRDNDGMGCENG